MKIHFIENAHESNRNHASLFISLYLYSISRIYFIPYRTRWNPERQRTAQASFFIFRIWKCFFFFFGPEIGNDREGKMNPGTLLSMQ